MDQFQIETLAGAVQLRQEEDIDTPVTMKELINLAHNLGCYEYRPGVVDDRTLGNVALENDLLDTISGLPEDVLDLLDEEKSGRKCGVRIWELIQKPDIYSQTVCRIRNGMTEFICRIFLICPKA